MSWFEINGNGVSPLVSVVGGELDGIVWQNG